MHGHEGQDMALYHLQVAKLTCISQPNRNDIYEQYNP